jgi:hypothetical protein
LPVQKPSSPSSDDNAATRQLLAESNSPTANLPSSSAVLGANLLNAARVNLSNSVAPSTAREDKPGKLKRVSIVGEGSRQNLAIRGDPYEIELSPEKGRYALPEKVNHKPLKINRKKKEKNKLINKKEQVAERAIERQSEVPVASSEFGTRNEAGPQVHEETVEDLAVGQPEIRSSPPEFAPPEPAPPASERAPSPSAPSESDNVVIDTISKSIPPSAGGKPAGGPENNGDTRPTPKRKSVSDHSEDQPSKILREQRRSKQTHPQVRIPVRQSSQQQNKANTTGLNNIQGTQKRAEGHPAQTEHSRSKPIARKLKPRKPRTNGTTVSSEQAPAKALGSQRRVESPEQAPEVADATETGKAPVIDGSEDDSDADEAGSVSDEADTIVRPTGKPGSIEAVFGFLNLGARSGRCHTILATTITRACDTYRLYIKHSDISLDTVAKDADKVQETLKHIDTGVEKRDQRVFKGDAYGHVFRALTLYLEALYTWLQDHAGEVTESLEAMKILSPLIHQILVFKDTIAEWDVSIPQRYKGDRIIKDVDVSLIAHLRQVHKVYRGRLSRLKAREEHRKLRKDLGRQMQEKQDEENRKVELLEARTERWKRWQALHIVRLTCEPDARRRNKLTITRLEDLEERDANGVVFERLPVFKSRSAPPHRQTSALDNKLEWTEQEETALLDGLKQFAGTSHKDCYVL